MPSKKALRQRALREAKKAAKGGAAATPGSGASEPPPPPAAAATAATGAGSAAAADTALAPVLPLPTHKVTIPPAADFEASIASLASKYAMYSALGKEEWWWIMDDTLADIAKCLKRHNHVYLDHFLPPSQVAAVRANVKAAYDSGNLDTGVLAGGKGGTSLSYVMSEVRGDKMGWFYGHECDANGWTAMSPYYKKVCTIVSELAALVPELTGIKNSSRMMLTCYPGGGTRYTKHCDNAHKNGRRLTSLLYLNPTWQADHGGQLRVFAQDAQTVVRDIAPLGGRLLLFFSDTRVPHEVMPTTVPRFACTIWFFDEDERREAENEDRRLTEEQRKARDERVQKEIKGFEAKIGGAKAQVRGGGGGKGNDAGRDGGASGADEGGDGAASSNGGRGEGTAWRTSAPPEARDNRHDSSDGVGAGSSADATATAASGAAVAALGDGSAPRTSSSSSGAAVAQVAGALEALGVSEAMPEAAAGEHKLSAAPAPVPAPTGVATQAPAQLPAAPPTGPAARGPVRAPAASGGISFDPSQFVDSSDDSDDSDDVDSDD